MSTHRSAAAILLAGLLTGCVTTQTTSFTPSAGQQALVRDGRSVLRSAKSKTEILASPTAREAPLGARSALVIGIRNLSKQPVTFRLAGVAATQIGGPQDGHDLKVFTYEELVNEERNRQIAAAIFAGVAAGANAYGASRSSHNPYVRSWNQQIAAQQNADLAQAVAVQGEINLATLETTIIKDNTLMPGETYGGVLVVSPPTTSDVAQPSDYRLSITLEGDRHEFVVNQRPVAR